MKGGIANLSLFDKLFGNNFKNQSSNAVEEDEEIYYCDKCGREICEDEFWAQDYLCDNCYSDKYNDNTPSWMEEEENYGPDADHNGVCDHCGKSRKYGNCTCW